MSTAAWGDKETQFFYGLTPDKILDSFEKATGLRGTGRVLALNSMENRVYEIEIELDEKPEDPSLAYRIAKFYRPGRWSREQIMDEHQFLTDLQDNDVPAVAALTLENGATVDRMEEVDINFAVFPKVGGRSPDELYGEPLEQVGRLLARLHMVGATRHSEHRIKLTPTSYGIQNLKSILDDRHIPDDLRANYQTIVEAICNIVDPWFAETKTQRVHGDCHLGNLLHGRQGFFWVDFDDMVVGPKVQDLWLLIPGRESWDRQNMQALLTAYDSMGHFDRTELRLIEPLRALRFIHFSAWIGKRWQDPAFPRAFPHFGEPKYWYEQLRDLQEQLQWIQNGGPV